MTIRLAVLGMAIAIFPLVRVFITEQSSIAQDFSTSPVQPQTAETAQTETCRLNNPFVFIQDARDTNISEVSQFTRIPDYQIQPCHLFQHDGTKLQPVDGLQAITYTEKLYSVIPILKNQGYQVFSHLAINSSGVIPGRYLPKIASRFPTGGTVQPLPEDPNLRENGNHEDINHEDRIDGDRPWVAPSSSDWIYPIQNPTISSPYGWRTTRRWGQELHAGVDFVAPRGTPVLATADGEVTFARESAGGGGLRITLSHPDGTRTIYGHLSKILVGEGMQVTQGETIGLVGSTGQSTGPHLHFELYPPGVYGTPVDPCRSEYLNCSSK